MMISSWRPASQLLLRAQHSRLQHEVLQDSQSTRYPGACKRCLPSSPVELVEVAAASVRSTQAWVEAARPLVSS